MKSKKKKKQRGNKKHQKSFSSSPRNIAQLAFTTTGELFQPIRIHYLVIDSEQLETYLSKLSCIDYDQAQNRWVWLYTKEARNLKFKYKPDEDNPVVLGELIFKGTNELVLNLRSLERAIQGIEFFNKHIPRSIAEAINITVVNKLFSVAEATSVGRLDEIFERYELTVRDPKAITQKLLSLKEEIQDEKERMEAIGQYLDERSMQTKPQMEKFPLNYYEDGISSLQASLMINQTVALQHWHGNKKYTSRDFFIDMMTQSQGDF